MDSREANRKLNDRLGKMMTEGYYNEGKIDFSLEESRKRIKKNSEPMKKSNYDSVKKFAKDCGCTPEQSIAYFKQFMKEYREEDLLSSTGKKAKINKTFSLTSDLFTDKGKSVCDKTYDKVRERFIKKVQKRLKKSESDEPEVEDKDIEETKDEECVKEEDKIEKKAKDLAQVDEDKVVKKATKDVEPVKEEDKLQKKAKKLAQVSVNENFPEVIATSATITIPDNLS